MDRWNALEYFANPEYINKFYDSSLRQAVLEWFRDKKSCEERYGHISNRDTEYVTNMCGLFENRKDFNEPLNWNTKNVTCMNRMFKGAISFDQHLNFDMQNVTSMESMFDKKKHYSFMYT